MSYQVAARGVESVRHFYLEGARESFKLYVREDSIPRHITGGVSSPGEATDANISGALRVAGIQSSNT
jgi:hypothetical protein